MAKRWRVAMLVAAAIAISYLDRQALPVAVKAIEADIPLTNTQFGELTSVFLLAYAMMYSGGGVIVDRLGTGRGRYVPRSTQLHFYPSDLSKRVPVIAAVKAVGFPYLE
jgi:hypothetical protein